MRAGELCGLRVDDLDLESRVLHIRQSAWRGKLQEPKTENAVRAFALSPQLIAHLKAHLQGYGDQTRGGCSSPLATARRGTRIY
jgi:integrase